jgi:hypothetical protein
LEKKGFLEEAALVLLIEGYGDKGEAGRAFQAKGTACGKTAQTGIGWEELIT